MVGRAGGELSKRIIVKGECERKKERVLKHGAEVSDRR